MVFAIHINELGSSPCGLKVFTQINDTAAAEKTVASKMTVTDKSCNLMFFEFGKMHRYQSKRLRLGHMILSGIYRILSNL